MRLNLHLKQLVLGALAGVFMLSSCGSVKDIAYFQNKAINEPEKIDKHAGIVIQPKDMLSIAVSSRNPELVAMFNLSLVQYTPGTEMGGAGGGQQRMLGYVVDNNGCIDFPVLGTLKVAGLTRWELAELIKTRLLKDGLLTDAVVTVEFMNFKVSVLGEVNHPDTYTIQGDKVTILQALSLAGDLTIYGVRENVSVIRESNGERTFYQVNLCDVDLFKSPAYYLQQNDVIYVEPSAERARQSTIDDKNLRLTSIAFSATSLLMSLATLIVGLIN